MGFFLFVWFFIERIERKLELVHGREKSSPCKEKVNIGRANVRFCLKGVTLELASMADNLNSARPIYGDKLRPHYGVITNRVGFVISGQTADLAHVDFLYSWTHGGFAPITHLIVQNRLSSFGIAPA